MGGFDLTMLTLAKTRTAIEVVAAQDKRNINRELNNV